MAYKRLGDILIASGTITEQQLAQALELQKGSKERLGTILIANNIITENQLIEVLQLQLGIEYIDLSKLSIPSELAQAVPKNIAKQFQVVPVRSIKDELYLAMADPLNFYAIEEVRRAARKKVVPLIAKAVAIDHAIMVLYGNEGAAKAIEDMKREAASSVMAEDPTSLTDQGDADNAASAPTIRLVNSILDRAISEHASDIHMEPREKELHVRIRVDGMMHDVLTIPKNVQGSVLSRVKIISGMDIAERRVPQDGRFNGKFKDKEMDFRVSTLPTIYGEKIVIRLLDKTAGRLTVENIGLAGEDLKKYRKIINHRSGVVLIAGPTGSGKSSTMYTMIGELNKEEVNLVTLEDPVEYNIDGINQVQINEKTGMTFANGLRAILRQDPDIIAVGEIRDGETADICMRAAITGHVVLSTIHTNDVIGTIERLRDIGCEPYLIGSALRGVISQRLVRRICPSCRAAYTPDASLLEDLQMNSVEAKDVTFYHGKGCPDCFNTGYRGRIAVFEMLQLNAKMRSAITRGADRSQLESYMNEDTEGGFVSMKDNALRLMKEGITTAEEVLRVIAEQE